MRPVRAAALTVLLGASLSAGAAGLARADGYLPYYGFSGYYGGPSVYYTHGTDVQQTTAMQGGDQGFGTRTYTSGGPFWRYHAKGIGRLPARREREALRVKG